MLNIRVDRIGEDIKATKRAMRAKLPDLKKIMAEVEDDLKREVEVVANARAKGNNTLPIIEYQDIVDEKVSAATKTELRRRGVAVVRGVYPKAEAEAWNDELGAYLEKNRYTERRPAPKVKDEYFSKLKSDKPQIFGIYWSKPQMQARTHPNSARTRAFMNRLWKYETDGKKHFDPDRETLYADRIRRRQPGDKTLGLSPHMDAGTVERWIDPGYQKVYERIFAGDWRGYDPFDGAHRLKTHEIPSPAVCSMFRTYQGWTALTRQGPRDGTLRLIPIAEGISYVLLRALQDDVPENDLCGAKPGRALGISPEWHKDLMAGMVSIPEVQPGDTVWWHTDICHAVADEHAGKEYASVIYIGSAPDCAKNRAYLPKQKEAFLAGRSAPDFAAMDLEVGFKGRATEADLTPLGRAQMGF